MPLFKRTRVDADQFRSKETGSVADPEFSLDSKGATGFTKISDTNVDLVLNNVSALSLRRGETQMYDNGATNGNVMSLFISGGALIYKGRDGTLTRLGVA